MIIVDGNNMVFGRVSSKIAKELMKNNPVVLINAEKMLISGDPQAVFERYKTKRSLKFKGDPEKSARWSRVPHMFVKRLIRGMLPWKKPKGKTAYRNLKVYEGVPEEVKGNPVVYDDCKPKNLSKHITVGELCKRFGYEGY